MGGLTGWEDRLKISDRAHLVFDFHQAVDGMQESNREGLANTTKLGTTKKGIGPTYASKMNRTGVRLADLMDNFADFSNKFSILADNYMASFSSTASLWSTSPCLAGRPPLLTAEASMNCLSTAR